MLLTQKAITEGARSMLYECAMLNDHLSEAELKGDTKEWKKVDDRMGFLTPILKGFLTEMGVEAANLGIQVFGGHGYIKSNKQEQVLRDVRIAPVWEGTTGIQALDLLGRKIMLQKLKPINEHVSKIYSFVQPLLFGPDAKLRGHAWKLLGATIDWHVSTYRIAMGAASNKDVIGVASVDYLMYSGYVSMGHHWLKMAQVASQKLQKGGDDEAEFYEAKLKTCDFYFQNILPRTKAHKATMFAPVNSIMGMKESQFSFDNQ
eukprot:GFYU01007599.1.p1 GENE.GFYU01007599.1~~GFYU01007599.1.p1  ORF type:complete len:299 (-),score=115.14 GFYU01007599.1:211-993(-)